MKRLFATLAAALVVLSLVGCHSNAELRVATFNIRYDSAADATTGDSWEERKGAVAELILSHDFDIVGTQEGDKRQIADLLELMPDYDCIGHPYGGGSGDLHTATIFYKRDRLELLDEGTFWYSPTPKFGLGCHRFASVSLGQVPRQAFGQGVLLLRFAPLLAIVRGQGQLG